MSRKSDLQFMADTALFRKIALIESGLEKNAGMSDGLLGGLIDNVTSAFTNKFSEVGDSTSAEGVVESLVKIMEPSLVLTFLGPLGMILDILAQELFDFSIAGVISNIIKQILPKIKSGLPVTTEDVHSAGFAAGGGLQSESSDLLADWREMSDRGELLTLFKNAYNPFKSNPTIKTPRIPAVRTPLQAAPAGVEFWRGLFSSAPPAKGRNFLLALPIWIVKTLLKGAGLFAIAGGIKSIFTGEKPGEKKPSQPSVREEVSNVPHFPDVKPNSFKASGNGEIVNQNDDNKAWYAPISGDVKQTLMNWAIQVYPELDNRQNDIVKSVSFNRMVNILKDFQEGSYINVPIGLETRKQIVDRFAGDIPTTQKVK